MAKKILILLIILLASATGTIHAQRVALKTNALEWVALSPNLALEARMSRRVTFNITMGGSPLSHYPALDNVRLRNFNITPSLRYWFNRPMARHFMGVNLTAVLFDVRLRDRCWSGDLFSAGLDYGYALVLSRHWNVEFTAGIGLGRARGYDYRSWQTRPSHPNMSRWVPVPRLGVSFAYIFK